MLVLTPQVLQGIFLLYVVEVMIGIVLLMIVGIIRMVEYFYNCIGFYCTQKDQVPHTRNASNSIGAEK